MALSCYKKYILHVNLPQGSYLNEREIQLKNQIKNNLNVEAEDFSHLLRLIKDDPELNSRVEYLLTLGSYQRRLVLNRWLEELRKKSASEQLRQALSYLFDNTVAQKVLTIIHNTDK